MVQLLHRGELPADLLDRLRHPAQFQGARYEIAVAATFIRAGLTIKFVPRDQAKRGKVWEFTARDGSAGVEIAVETKSRHRPGALGFPGTANAETAVRGDVDGLVNEALEQDPGTMPFVIFVEVNVPPAPGVPFEQRQWGRDINDMMQSIPPTMRGRYAPTAGGRRCPVHGCVPLPGSPLALAGAMTPWGRVTPAGASGPTP